MSGADPPTATGVDAAGELFDRYLLPKVALTIILAASLVGTWLSTSLAGGATPGFVLAKWAYLVALGTLAGGLCWKHGFVRPADLAADAGEYCAAMYARFDRIAAAAAAVLLGCGALTVASYVATLGWTGPVTAVAACAGALVVLVAATATRDAPVDAQFRSAAGVAALAAALGLVGATAAVEVALRGGDLAAVAVRLLHLLAFAVWVGGAVWNIFVAVPTGQRRPTTPVVRAAGEQLERFRWAVRLIIPTLLATGLYQGVDALGLAAGAYLGSAVGLAVLAKLGAIGVLLVVFRLCPMWRACSPIEGVCELEDLGAGEPDGGAGDQDGGAGAPDSTRSGRGAGAPASDGGLAEVSDDD